jgi:UDP-N-acetylmuramate--alanine ligase
MNTIPLNIGTLHFVGIGGIGMSGIAEILMNLGYNVQGSDIAESANVSRLKDKGVTVHIGHKAENIANARVVVISSAVKMDNPEVVAAREKGIPVVRRAEMLAELMRLKSSIAVAGTHGKTTTTSMVAALLDAAHMDPTVINGGIINAYATNARLGDGDWMIVEADESDGTFNKVPATVGIVTNIDPEHLDHYGDFDTLRDAFRNFVQSIPFYGFACLCIDHPEVQSMLGKINDRKIITYGENPQADLRVSNITPDITGLTFDLHIQARDHKAAQTIQALHLPMFGRHNVLNSLAAIGVALELGLTEDTIRTGLANFAGVKRRFTKTGEVNGVTIIDDYAHHPVEISAVLAAAREACAQKVIAVMQPHRFSRLSSLFDDFCTCFNDADHVIVAPVHAAGEAPIAGYLHTDLAQALKVHGHRAVQTISSAEELPQAVHALASPGDIVVCLGAGSISAWANGLPTQLEALQDKT